ncbi:hypothetical protein G6F57_021232 [Rhizopus arrhizus]|nr:hypothetical protein G6F57_021232 [Rhizopus arrhizus]
MASSNWAVLILLGQQVAHAAGGNVVGADAALQAGLLAFQQPQQVLARPRHGGLRIALGVVDYHGRFELETIDIVATDGPRSHLGGVGRRVALRIAVVGQPDLQVRRRAHQYIHLRQPPVDRGFVQIATADFTVGHRDVRPQRLEPLDQRRDDRRGGGPRDHQRAR